jgi:hypothetical protein
MANVKVCDRCGKKLIDKQSLLSLKAVRYRLGVEVLEKMRYYDTMRRIDYSELDFCEECTNKLVDFIDGKPVEGLK